MALNHVLAYVKGTLQEESRKRNREARQLAQRDEDAQEAAQFGDVDWEELHRKEQQAQESRKRHRYQREEVSAEGMRQNLEAPFWQGSEWIRETLETEDTLG